MNHDPLVGQTLGGNFRILELIGQGGMGRVYLAEQLSLERKVAVKVLHPHLAEEPLFVRRFWTEAKAASRLMHPNCAAILHFGVEADRPYLVMEHLVGRSLSEALSGGALPTPARACSIAIDMLDALDEAHALGVVHRDLKPDNIFLAERRGGGEVVKIVDFGVARLSTASDAAGPTEPGAMAGTPAYMSPEQCTGQPVDGRSDLYAVGVVLFEMLTGRTPFFAEEAMAVVLQHITKAPPDPREVRPERSLPGPLCELVLRSLAKQPDQRFASAGEMREALLEAAKGLPRSSMRAPRSSSPSLPKAPAQPTTRDAAARVVRQIVAQVERQLSQGAAVSLLGRPGSGKTAALDALEQAAGERGERVTRARAHPSRAPVPYWPIARLVEALSGRTLEALLAEPEGLGPLERAGLREIAAPSGLASIHVRSRAPAVGSLLSSLVARESRGKPLWLLADDVESFDALSREALSWLVREPPSALRAVFATGEPTRGVKLASPITVAQGSIDESWAPLRLELAEAYGPLPDGTTSLIQLVLLHLERLSPRARELAAASAVLGEVAPRPLLSALCPHAPPQAYLELEASRLARGDEQALRMPRAIGQVVEGAMPAEARRRLHSLARDLLDEQGAPLEVLALHACEGSEPAVAMALLAAAGEQASQRGDHEAAVSFFSQRLERARAEIGVSAEPLFEQVASRSARDLAQALLDAGRPAEGAGLLRELGGLDASPRERAARGLVAARCARRRGRLDEALAGLDEALSSEAAALLHRAEALLELAEIRLAQGDGEGARGALDQIAPLVERRALDADALPRLALRLGQLRARLGDERARLDLERAAALARGLGLGWLEAEATGWLSRLEASRGSMPQARSLGERARSLWALAGDRQRLAGEGGERAARSPGERPGGPSPGGFSSLAG